MQKAKNTPHSWSEDKLQMNVFVWYQNTYKHLHGLLFHVPNENQDGKRGKKMQFMGVVPGVADLLFFVGTPTALELKRPDGKNNISPAQKKWRDQWTAAGNCYFVFNDELEIKNFIINRINHIFGEKEARYI